MIVRNEERCIERALAWASGVADERIVVDTGSTDRTVELAIAAGAVVYNFTWVDDFSKAKNYAMSLCKGDWILFLDADEWFTESDAAALPTIIADYEKRFGKRCNTIPFNKVNIDLDGSVLAEDSDLRVFRNIPKLRFEGSIHEAMPKAAVYPGGFIPPTCTDIKMLHDGYAPAIYAETKKLERNITLLRKELASDPTNPYLMEYLSESLRVNGTERDRAEALELSKRAIPLITDPDYGYFKEKAYNYCIHALAGASSPGSAEFDEGFRYAELAYKEFPNSADLSYEYAFCLYQLRRFREAYEVLLVSEKALKDAGLDSALYDGRVYLGLLLTANELNEKPAIIRSATFLLTKNKFHDAAVTTVYIQALRESADAETVLRLLGGLYDLNNLRDKLWLLKAAGGGYPELYAKLRQLITPEELEYLRS
ncbi:MAG: glycosyltransferase [Oscillospiraceae bacterium]|jgi:glycosyltransferase involved in cell wall biosynthesis|nr:glycosyltransferase [Oscillospiraceae bacterium]